VGLLALFDTQGPGYPRLRPGTTRFRAHCYRWARRVEHHLDSLRLLGFRDGWAYVIQKARKGGDNFRKSVRRRIRRLLRNSYLALGRPLPSALQQTQNTIMQASASYVPGAYAGRVTLFRASKQPLGIVPDPTLGWGDRVEGGLELNEVPGYHAAIMSEPRVRVLAEKLKVCLERAQAAMHDEIPHSSDEPFHRGNDDSLSPGRPEGAGTDPGERISGVSAPAAAPADLLPGAE
jgi:hypothetical protein